MSPVFSSQLFLSLDFTERLFNSVEKLTIEIAGNQTFDDEIFENLAKLGEFKNLKQMEYRFFDSRAINQLGYFVSKVIELSPKLSMIYDLSDKEPLFEMKDVTLFAKNGDQTLKIKGGALKSLQPSPFSSQLSSRQAVDVKGNSICNLIDIYSCEIASEKDLENFKDNTPDKGKFVKAKKFHSVYLTENLSRILYKTTLHVNHMTIDLNFVESDNYNEGMLKYAEKVASNVSDNIETYLIKLNIGLSSYMLESAYRCIVTRALNLPVKELHLDVAFPLEDDFQSEIPKELYRKIVNNRHLRTLTIKMKNKKKQLCLRCLNLTHLNSHDLKRMKAGVYYALFKHKLRFDLMEQQDFINFV